YMRGRNNTIPQKRELVQEGKYYPPRAHADSSFSSFSRLNRAPSANVPPRNSAVCLQLHGLFFMWWTPFKWLKNVALKCVNCVPLQHLFPPFSISFSARILQPRSHQRSRCQYQVTEHTLLPTSPITNLLSVSSCLACS